MRQGIMAHEVRKCFGSGWFKLSLFLGCLMALTCFCEAFHYVSTGPGPDGYYVSCVGSYANWMVVSCGQGPFAAIFFYVVPLLSTIPFSCSFRSERISGYEAQLVIRADTRSRLLSKMFATFLSGFVVIALSLGLNFLITSCFLPAWVPLIEEEMVTGIFTDCLFSELFYSKPLFYVLAYTFLDGLIAGVWSVFVLSVSFVIKNRVFVVVIPYLCLLCWQYLTNQVIGISGLVFCSVNIVDAMKGTYYVAKPDLASLTLQLVIMLSISVVLAFNCSKQDAI